jgi:3-hydroxy acid dehydrogenase/malonic semialdehyde reductase
MERKMSLKNKTALITGASAGFGKAIAQALAGEGCRLIITGRRRENLEALASELGVPCHVLAFDIRDRAAMQSALASIPAEFSAIDILVNNAGLALDLSKFDEGDFADFETMVETNILGLLAMTHAILPGMKQRGYGHIVNIASTAGNFHYPGAHVYGGSKAFVTYFSQALRADLLGSPIRVTNLEPGMAETEFSNVRFKGDQTKAKAVYAGVDAMQAGDVAEAVRWALAQPLHVNISRIEMMPTAQAPAGMAVARKS